MLEEIHTFYKVFFSLITILDTPLIHHMEAIRLPIARYWLGPAWGGRFQKKEKLQQPNGVLIDDRTAASVAFSSSPFHTFGTTTTTYEEKSNHVLHTNNRVWRSVGRNRGSILHFVD